MSRLGKSRGAMLLATIASFVACGLETEGQLAPEGDASVSGGGGSGGGSGTANNGGSWADAQAGGAGGNGTGGTAANGGASGASGTSGTGGTSGTAGSAGTSPCTANDKGCSAPGECCSGICGVGSDSQDCNTADKCHACNDDTQCPTGRCEGCDCVDKGTPGDPCNEPSDCNNDRCGFGAGADTLDCNTDNQCIECDQDSQCGTGRCEDCGCAAKLAFDDSCNEDSDCTSGMCGAEVFPDNDCDNTNRCAGCRNDSDCPSGRCDGCECLPQLPKNDPCNENTDCQSGNCTISDKCF